jgi:hypothetical protein
MLPSYKPERQIAVLYWTVLREIFLAGQRHSSTVKLRLNRNSLVAELFASNSIPKDRLTFGSDGFYFGSVEWHGILALVVKEQRGVISPAGACFRIMEELRERISHAIGNK